MTNTGSTTSLTQVFDDMKREDFIDALDGLRTEAGAAILSGDTAVQKWARSVGVMATVLHKALTGDTSILPGGAEEPPPPPVEQPNVGGLTPPTVPPVQQP